MFGNNVGSLNVYVAHDQVRDRVHLSCVLLRLYYVDILLFANSNFFRAVKDNRHIYVLHACIICHHRAVMKDNREQALLKLLCRIVPV